MATKKSSKSKAVVLSEREAPIERKMSMVDIISSVMAKAQLEVLTAKTPEHAIKTRPGAKGRALKYVPHGYVTDTLNRAFGFDWDYKLMPYFGNGNVYHLETIQTGIHPKTKEPIIMRYVTVYGELTIRVHNPKKMSEIIATVTKPGPGSSVWYPENELGDAIKAAKSDGLKVAAHELGIALDLYWDDEAEQDKYNQIQEDKRRQQEQEAIDVFAEDVVISPNGDNPVNGIQLISIASAKYKYDLSKVQEILGLPLAQFNDDYKPEYWDKIVKHYGEHNDIEKEPK